MIVFLGGYVLGFFSAVFIVGSWIVFKSEGYIPYKR